MRLTQAQVRQLAEVKEETFRVWREGLPPLARRSGRGALFTLGDAVAVTVIRSLVQAFGVKIQQLASVSPELFEACADATLPSRGDALLVISGDRATLSPAQSTLPELDGAALVVPLSPILAKLRGQLLQSAQEVQAQLPLGPTAVPRPKRA